MRYKKLFVSLHRKKIITKYYEQCRVVYQRFSPREQHGCAEGGATHVIASLLAGAKAGTDRKIKKTLQPKRLLKSSTAVHRRSCNMT
jgi:hypothetical protein